MHEWRHKQGSHCPIRVVALLSLLLALTETAEKEKEEVKKPKASICCWGANLRDVALKGDGMYPTF
jgi:hypothetical protein